jgi:hypothetical protein
MFFIKKVPPTTHYIAKFVHEIGLYRIPYANVHGKHFWAL